ncbi:MAG: methyl-accepting chemotaxis protein [Velocimicrobium sp.]
MKFRGKILSMVLGPAIVIGVTAIIITGIEVKQSVQDQIKNQLKVAAYAGEEAYEQEEVVNAGSTNNDEINHVIDTIYDNGGVHISIFEGDERIASTIKDEKGTRVVGTKAPEEVANTVLNQGKEYFDEVVVEGEDYYAYYIPIKGNGSENVTGIFVAANPQKVVQDTYISIVFKIAIGIIVIVLITIIFESMIIQSITKTMSRNVEVLKRISEGELSIEQDKKDILRKDEIGDIANATLHLKDSLKNIISGVNQTASSLLGASEELEQVSEETATTTDGIEKAVEEVALGATSQAQSTEEASRETIIMGENIENTSNAIQQLHINSDKMIESGTVAMNTLDELNVINEKTKLEIDTIYQQTNETNDFALKIQEAANIITSIANETNLLSLNASIEAARAGESGKGFAVVADQIKKLAEQSGKSAKEIGNVIHTLIDNSNKAVETMHAVKETIEVQNSHLNRTKDSFKEVYYGINHSTDQIKEIADITKSLNESRITVVDIITNLSAISEENAASTEETSASTAQLTAAVNDIRSEITVLRTLSDELVEAISIFKL